MHVSISVALGMLELRRVVVAAEMLLPVLGQPFPLYLLYCDFFPFSLYVLTCPIRCRLQSVSTPRSVGFFASPDLSLAMLSPESECPLLGRILSVF